MTQTTISTHVAAGMRAGAAAAVRGDGRLLRTERWPAPGRMGAPKPRPIRACRARSEHAAPDSAPSERQSRAPSAHAAPDPRPRSARPAPILPSAARRSARRSRPQGPKAPRVVVRAERGGLRRSPLSPDSRRVDRKGRSPACAFPARRHPCRASGAAAGGSYVPNAGRLRGGWERQSRAPFAHAAPDPSMPRPIPRPRSAKAAPHPRMPRPIRALGAPARLPSSHPLPGGRHVGAARRGQRPQGWWYARKGAVSGEARYRPIRAGSVDLLSFCNGDRAEVEALCESFAQTGSMAARSRRKRTQG